jgi:hypothetical protein
MLIPILCAVMNVCLFKLNGKICIFGVLKNVKKKINLKQLYSKTIVSIRWPPRSPDLNPLDSFQWSYIRNNVYLVPRL